MTLPALLSSFLFLTHLSCFLYFSPSRIWSIQFLGFFAQTNIFTRCDRVAPGLGTTNLLPPPPLLLPLLLLTVTEFSAGAILSIRFSIFSSCDRVAPGLGTTNLLPPLLLLTVTEFSDSAILSIHFSIFVPTFCQLFGKFITGGAR
jgi:hypothetical protein